MKETAMLLLPRCILCMVFWNYKVLGFFVTYFNLSLATHVPDERKNFWKLLVRHGILNLACWSSFDTSCQNSMYKNFFVLEFWVLRQSDIDIFLFVEHPIYGIFNVQSVAILDCWFYFVTSYPNSMFKTFLFSKF